MSAVAAAAGPAVAVERLDALCLVEAGPAAERERADLDRVARTRLGPALARALGPVLDPGDASVWLIRELEADVALEVGEASEDDLAREWAHGIAGALAETLAAGPDGNRVVRFASRGALLASFAANVVAGRAWESWWYASLHGLRSLPAGTAVREALVASPADGVEALARLVEERSVERVLDALSEHDAGAVLAACFPDRGRPGAVDPDVAAAVLAAVRAPGAAADDRVTAKRALEVVVRAPAVARGAPLRGLAERLLAVVALTRAVGADACVRALRAGDTAALVRAARDDAAVLGMLAELVELAAAEPGLVARAARAAEPPDRAPDRGGTTLLTDIGGVFLLLPAVIELGLPGLLGLDAALRVELLARCAALDPFASSDPALLLAAGADAPPAEPALDLGPAAGHLLLERLVRLERVPGACLAAELAPTPHGEALVLRDTARDAWAYAEHVQAPEAEAALARGLRLVRAASEARCACVVLGPGLDRLAPVARAEADAVLTREAAAPAAAPGAVAAALERWLAHARAPDDLMALSRAGTPAAPDLAGALAAHALLRGLSGRLLGFDLSSAAYLRESFLRIRATIRVRDGAIDVDLAPSPLQVVLQLAGHHGATTAVPWLGAEVTVRLGDGR